MLKNNQKKIYKFPMNSQTICRKSPRDFQINCQSIKTGQPKELLKLLPKKISQMSTGIPE